jgi:hypothetical protein
MKGKTFPEPAADSIFRCPEPDLASSSPGFDDAASMIQICLFHYLFLQARTHLTDFTFIAGLR